MRLSEKKLAVMTPPVAKRLLLVSHQQLFPLIATWVNYSLDAFDLGASGYLVKPIPFEPFFKVVNRILSKSTFSFPAKEAEPEVKEAPKGVFVKADSRIIKLDFEEVQVVESLKEYIRIHLKGKKPITVLASLTKMEMQFPTSMFIRVHRSYIINWQEVEEIDGNMVKIKDHYIPIGKTYRDAFMLLINQNRLDL